MYVTMSTSEFALLSQEQLVEKQAALETELRVKLDDWESLQGKVVDELRPFIRCQAYDALSESHC